MLTDNEQRLFRHLMRLVSVLMIIQMDHENGHSSIALAANLTAARNYLMENCPALLQFTERCYRQQPIPEGLSMQAERETVFGRLPRS